MTKVVEQDLELSVFLVFRKGHDAGDHPPITPMRPATRDELDGDSWRIYDYVVRHFVATVSHNCKYQSTMIFFDVGNEKFSFTGKKLLSPGENIGCLFFWLDLPSAALNIGLTLDVNNF